ncbi:MAG: tripartite tricarboxylate transporter TctB family protein [Thermodesulfobacteriota bacterium]
MQSEKLKDPKVRGSLVGAAVLALLALFVGGVVLSTLKLRHPTTVLGPGFYPLLLSVLMFIACLYVIYSLLFGDREAVNMKSVLDRAALKKPMALFLLSVVCVAAMPLLGFMGAMFVFCFIQMTYLEKEKQPLIWRLVYSAAIVGGVYWLFRALMIYLPAPFWL